MKKRQVVENECWLVNDEMRSGERKECRRMQGLDIYKSFLLTRREMQVFCPDEMIGIQDRSDSGAVCRMEILDTASNSVQSGGAGAFVSLAVVFALEAASTVSATEAFVVLAV